MKIPLAAVLVLAGSFSAGPQALPGASSPHFAIEPRVLDGGGGKSKTSRFEFVSSLDSFGPAANSASKQIQLGFVGQLFEPTSITFFLAIEVMQPSGLHIQIQGPPDRAYQLQSANALAVPVAWSNFGSPKTAGANGIVQYQDIPPASPRFYRAVAGQ